MQIYKPLVYRYCYSASFTSFSLMKLMKYCVLQQIWETNKVCKSSDAVLKSELDVAFHNDEVMILAIYNQKHLQVSCISQYFSTCECYLQISVGN